MVSRADSFSPVLLSNFSIMLAHLKGGMKSYIQHCIQNSNH